MVKKPNWQEADQVAIHKCGKGETTPATGHVSQLDLRPGSPDFKSDDLTT